MIRSKAKYSKENKQTNFRSILNAHSNATWTLAAITNGQVHGIDSAENKQLDFGALLHARSNAIWTLVVILLIRSVAKYSTAGKRLDS